jgi:hypothetical protein
MTEGYLVLAMVAVFLLGAEVSKLSFQNLVLARENHNLREHNRVLINANVQSREHSHLMWEYWKERNLLVQKYSKEAADCKANLTECTHEAAAFQANVTEFLRDLRVELDEKEWAEAQNACARSRGKPSCVSTALRPFFTTDVQLYTAPPPAQVSWSHHVLRIALSVLFTLTCWTLRRSRISMSA